MCFDSNILAAGTGMGAALFWLMALLAGLSAVGLVVSRNVVRMAVCLLFTLVGVAGLYLLLDAEFIAAVQIVVYAGGTLILIIFGVMLTSKLPFSRLTPRRGEVMLALGLAVVMLAGLVLGIREALLRGELQARPGPAGGAYPMRELGQALLGDYLVPFEIASVLLLVVMIGAAYLAKGRRRQDSGLEK